MDHPIRGVCVVDVHRIARASKGNRDAVLHNMFTISPEETGRVETEFRKIVTPLPVPNSCESLAESSAVFPQVNCYQPPIVWDRAEGFQVFDPFGNCWIDFSSTAVMTNTGHAHPKIRNALGEHAHNGLLAQFSFASDIRLKLAKRLLSHAAEGIEKVYFWTVGSEAIECAYRLVLEYGQSREPTKNQILTFNGDYHGWTLAAHRLSGTSAEKHWLPCPEPNIHHLSHPSSGDDINQRTDTEWIEQFDRDIADLTRHGVDVDSIAAIFIETLQGWGALSLPVAYVRRLRQWADRHDVLVVFDEIQTGFGRTGKWFGHEHYGVRADLICIGKGLTSSLPLAAVLGPAHLLDILAPGEITTTHAAHPLSCAAALANLDVLESEDLVAESERKGKIARTKLQTMQHRFPQIAKVSGLGLLNAIHVKNPQTGEPDAQLARDWTWESVKRGVMLFYTNRATIKICPPLVIDDDALCEGIDVLADALEATLDLRGSSKSSRIPLDNRE